MTPEEKARESIDGMLVAAGWIIQNRTDANIDDGPGVAIREFSLAHGFGEADYLLFADGQAVGVVEAKREARRLSASKPRRRSIVRASRRPSRPRGDRCHSSTSPPALRPVLPTCLSPTPPAEVSSLSTSQKLCPNGCGMSWTARYNVQGPSRHHAAACPFRPLAGSVHRRQGPRGLARPQPPPFTDSDANRVRQDIHGLQRPLPAYQVCRRSARSVPRRPRQPRPPDPERVSGVPHPG